MKIYFAGSIRGGRGDLDLYLDMIGFLRTFGEVLTEHVGDRKISERGEKDPDQEIYRKDMEWLKACDAVVAEVTTPSLGVGYEIGAAEAMGKPILCLFREGSGKNLSAMIAGNHNIEVRVYEKPSDAVNIFKDFFKGL